MFAPASCSHLACSSSLRESMQGAWQGVVCGSVGRYQGDCRKGKNDSMTRHDQARGSHCAGITGSRLNLVLYASTSAFLKVHNELHPRGDRALPESSPQSPRGGGCGRRGQREARAGNTPESGPHQAGEAHPGPISDGSGNRVMMAPNIPGRVLKT